MFRKTALLAAFCLLPLSQASAESWFEVEVFLFERNQPSAEVWPETPKQPNLAKGRDLITPALISAPDSSMTPCSADERAVDQLRCDALDLQIGAYVPEYPKPFPVTVAAANPASATPGASAVLLGKNQLQFTDAVRQLSREAGVKPLLHMSWQQAMQPRHASVPVRLFAGEDFSDRFVAAGTRVQPSQPYPEALESTPLGEASATAASAASAAASAEQPQDSNLAALLGGEQAPVALRRERPDPVWQLDGLLNIYLSHYLYIETDLMLRSPGSRKVEVLEETAALQDSAAGDLASGDIAALPGSTSALPATNERTIEAMSTEVVMEEQPFLYSIPLTQNRRVRSGQIHYFDHPKLGLVIQIRKMAQPAGAVDAEEPATEPEGDDTPENDVINQQGTAPQSADEQGTRPTPQD
ncbi:peptidoglycan binding protein CsiV [Shewanella khirikhana]|uniref:Peptidoglycan-binding protein n=1 Tax=Shewanella khirikhana TaxID=1965282 RepID=A0ABM7D100_9GAMM|nr:peptidoglycan binding protein CsiV [Shewanella khirikhana]AZQ10035.1 hypothetical protein STH12_00899 [Shewanella khirikhana]